MECSGGAIRFTTPENMASEEERPVLLAELLKSTPVMDVPLPKKQVITVQHDADVMESFKVRCAHYFRPAFFQTIVRAWSGGINAVHSTRRALNRKGHF